MRIILAGGGSGGHITPLLAVIEEIEKNNPSAEMIFIGSKGGMEEKLVTDSKVRVESIRSGKFRRYHRNKILNLIDPTTVFKNALDFKSFILGIFDSLKILKAEDPDLILLKGGYVSLPFGIACRIKGYPYFLHESDVIPGLANRLLQKKAEKTFVSYPLENFPEMDKEKLVYSGNPVRKDLIFGSKKEAYEKFNLDKNLKTILVMGGSQGARRINEIFSEKLEDYLEKYQVIHIAGDLDYDWLDYESKKIKNIKRYKLFNFLTADLKDALAVADVVISRAGNNVLTELALLSKPTIVIPLESSANDHQFANAKAYSREGAALIMLQSHLTPEKLFRQVELLMNDPEELSFLSEKIHKFYKEDAAGTIVRTLTEYYKSVLRSEANAKQSKDRQGKEK